MGRWQIKCNKDRIAMAKERLIRWYTGDGIEMPYVLHVPPAAGKVPGYSLRQIIEDPYKAVEQQIARFNWQFEGGLQDCDWIPYFSPVHLGQGLIPSMFGAKQHVVDCHSPFTEGRLLQRIEEVEELPDRIDPARDGWGPKLKELCQLFAEAGNGEVPICPPDHQSPYGIATKLIANEDLMLAMYDAPELVDRLLTICTNALIDVIRAMEQWVGASNVVRNSTIPVSHPAAGLILWDDYVSVITPALHKRFCLPQNLRCYEELGYGHLHTCGPYFEGYVEAMFACKPVSVDVTIMRGMAKGREDMLQLRRLANQHGIRLVGSLASNAQHQFSADAAQPPDEEFVKAMAAGGLLWTETGPMETVRQYADWAQKIGLAL